ncbi:potassium-transporting ATPase subunit F [Arcanobacterium bovis]|uniref:Potassium-transporting ATPase subunit F n=1 Tax=Arcanobacterium bovis TaxID=2529275 RepID=A0A4Q9UYS6_9ACTO|nr:potassium-transporting ATPase subunit F [Arcanobacterium bovis]TBW20860.1 potassium-transporting ATPase subunit F [Arcanobacterium bovis]
MWESVLALGLGIGAIVYLLIALFDPERFS